MATTNTRKRGMRKRKMKVIFLDVDGVLNSLSCKEKIEGYIFVEDEKIARLKEIIDHTGAKVVLSSTWRYGWHAMEHVKEPDENDLRDIYMFEALRDKLLEHGIELLGYTKDFGRRGDEISDWLKKWMGEPIETYVILDDMGAVEMRTHCRYLVQTSISRGLEQKHIKRAIDILHTFLFCERS